VPLVLSQSYVALGVRFRRWVVPQVLHFPAETVPAVSTKHMGPEVWLSERYVCPSARRWSTYGRAAMLYFFLISALEESEWSATRFGRLTSLPIGQKVCRDGLDVLDEIISCPCQESNRDPVA
jgi:hypothetical protein